MKEFSLLIMALCCTLFVNGQDLETKARATYLVAEEAYNNGDFKKAYDKLAETEKYLGKTNSKIEYLKVKALLELKDFPRAKSALTKYFEIVKDKESEKYNEMLRLLGTIDDAMEQNNSSREFKEKTAYLIRAIDSMAKKSYYFMQDEKKMQKSKVISVTLDYENATVNTFYLDNISKSGVGDEVKFSFPLRDVKEVYYHGQGNGKVYDIEVMYNSPIGTKKEYVSNSMFNNKQKEVPIYEKSIFFSLTGEVTTKKIVFCLRELKELFERYKGEMPN